MPSASPGEFEEFNCSEDLIPKIQRFHSVTNVVHSLVPSRVWAWHKTTRLVPQARPTSGLGLHTVGTHTLYGCAAIALL